MSAPERILAWPSAGQYQGVSLAGGNPDCMVEYIRADLAPAAPKVKALVEALRDALDAWDTHNETGDMMDGYWVSDARAALAALEGGDG